MTKKYFEKIAKIWSDFLPGSTFFLPVLGPVHCLPSKKNKLLFDLLNNTTTKKFLSYDKNRRWFREKQEEIILSSIKIIDDGLFIVSHNSFFKKTNVYYYSKTSPNEKVLSCAWKLAKENRKSGDNEIGLYCFIKPKLRLPFSTQNVYLKKITKKDLIDDEFSKTVYYQNLNLKQKKTFSFLGIEEDQDGFNFLWQKYLKQKKTLNQIICVLEKEKIVGAIGPLDISVDVCKRPFLQPPFFGVLSQYKRTGLGKKLWRSAMDYAYLKNARYNLVSNVPNSPAGKFYEKQGLEVACQVFSCVKKI